MKLIHATVLMTALAMPGAAYALGSCPDPYQIDVLGQCVCPNIKEKLSLIKRGFNVEAVCPAGRADKQVNQSNRGQHWSWDIPIVDKDGNPVLDEDGNPTFVHHSTYDGQGDGQNGLDIPAEAINVSTDGAFH